VICTQLISFTTGLLFLCQLSDARYRKFARNDITKIKSNKAFVDIRLCPRCAAPVLDLAGISIEFSGAITTQFCFTYSIEGVTAMPRGLHARLCHTVLVLKKETTGCTSLPILNSIVTEPKFTRCTHNVARSSKMNLLKSEWRYAKPFWNAKVANENESADFAHFDPKIGCNDNVP